VEQTITFESLGFALSYRCSVVDPVPDNQAGLRTFRGRGIGPWAGGLTIGIDPAEGLPWVGQFEYDAALLDKVCASPSPKRVIVVARGEGYIVRADRPDDWEYIAVAPVLDVRRVPEREILICADYQNLAAYSKSGLIWTIEHLALDDLEITKVLPAEIQGFLRHEDLGKVPFSVDPSTGRVEGGSGFAKLLVPPWNDAEGTQQLASWSD
jgi:hypothetical protein